MSNPFPQAAGLDYLSAEYETIVLSLLGAMKPHYALLQRSYPHHDLVLQTLKEWHVPMRTYAAWVACLCKRFDLPFPDFELASFSEQDYRAAGKIAFFLQNQVNPADDESRKRIAWASKLREMFAFAYEDPDLILIPVADHAAKMRGAEMLDHTRQRMLYEENEAVFLPLIEFLGFWDLRRTLGNQSLEFLNPGKISAKITEGQKFFQQKQQRFSIYEKIETTLEEARRKARIQAVIEPHESSASSVYRRILRGDSLYTILRQLRFKIVVQSEEDCYRMLHLIHTLWEPVSGRTTLGDNFRDQVSTPKFNGYRALITQVNYPLSNEPKASTAVEFRIFTAEMKKGNALGFVAYRYLLDLRRPLKNLWWENPALRQFIHDHPLGSSSKEIYVFSPIGKVYRGLPAGSTPIDYAYHIHSEVGKHCKRIWINGQMAEYDQRLKNGDLVEIEVDPKYQGPDERWLKVVKTKTAINRIKSEIVKSSPPPGRQIIDKVLERELRLYDLRNEALTERFEVFIEKIAKHNGYSNKNALYLDIAEPHHTLQREKVAPEVLVSHFITRYLTEQVARTDGHPLPPPEKVRFVHCEHGEAKRVSPGTKMIGRLARRKVPDGTVIEFLSVYRADCPQAAFIPDSERVSLEWLGDRRKGTPVLMSINAADRPGLLEHVLRQVYDLYEQEVYLLALNAEVQAENTAQIVMTLDAPNVEAVQNLSSRFEAIRRRGLIDAFQFHALSPLEKLRLHRADSIHNPFTTGPACTTKIFKGREYEISKIIGAMESEKHLVILHGINRVGKTSLLRFIQSRVAAEYNFAAAFVDLQRLTAFDEQGFWSELAQQIVAAVRAQPDLRGVTIRGYPFKNKDNAYEAFLHFWKDVRPLFEGRKLLVMIDEFSMIDDWKDKAEASRLVARLKSLVEGEPNLYWVICVQQTVYWQGMDMMRNLRLSISPLLRTGVTVHLEFFDRTTASRLIDEPVGQMLHFDEEVRQKLLDITACHPYFLQIILYEIVEQANHEHEYHITSDRLNKCLEQVMEQEIIFHSFTMYSDSHVPNASDREPTERDILSTLAQLSGDEAKPVSVDRLSQALQRRHPYMKPKYLTQKVVSLCEAGVLAKHTELSHQSVSIRVPLFREWLSHNLPLYTVR